MSTKQRVITLDMLDIATAAGFPPAAGGKLNLPATPLEIQQVGDLLADAAARLVGQWQPGDPVNVVTLTGPGPIWAYLAVAHSLHGRCVSCTYASPNATYRVWEHGHCQQAEAAA